MGQSCLLAWSRVQHSVPRRNGPTSAAARKQMRRQNALQPTTCDHHEHFSIEDSNLAVTAQPQRLHAYGSCSLLIVRVLLTAAAQRGPMRINSLHPTTPNYLDLIILCLLLLSIGLLSTLVAALAALFWIRLPMSFRVRQCLNAYMLACCECICISPTIVEFMTNQTRYHPQGR